MADIIDEFVVSLKLDGSQYTAETKKFRADLKKNREEADTNSKEMELGNKRAVQGFRTLRNEVGGLFLAFAGASSLKGFISDILLGAANTGRLAANINVATQSLSAWQMAVKSVGGSSADADQGLTAGANIYQNYQQGDNSKGGILAALGMSPADFKNADEGLLKLAQASERMPKQRFVSLASMLGLNQNLINLLEMGRGNLERLIQTEKEHGATTDQDAKAAQDLQSALADLGNTIVGAVRPAITGLARDMVDAAKGTGDAGLAAKIAAAPWIALGNAISYATSKLQQWLGLSGPKADKDKDIIRRYLEAGQYKNAYLYAMRRNGLLTNPNSAPPPPPGGWDAPAGRGASSAGAATGTHNIEAQLRGAGFTPEQAKGVAAGIIAESGGHAQAVNPTSGAYGLGQWLGSRKKELFRRYGNAPSPEQQIEFLIWELKGGDKGGPSVGRQTTADHALLAYIVNFMRPGPGAAGDMRRGRAFLNGSPIGAHVRGGHRSSTSTSTSTNNITVYANTNDPKRLGQQIGHELDKRATIVNANSGMQP